MVGDSPRIELEVAEGVEGVGDGCRSPMEEKIHRWFKGNLTTKRGSCSGGERQEVREAVDRGLNRQRLAHQKEKERDAEMSPLSKN